MLQCVLRGSSKALIEGLKVDRFGRLAAGRYGRYPWN
jgi:hypothetical protein